MSLLTTLLPQFKGLELLLDVLKYASKEGRHSQAVHVLVKKGMDVDRAERDVTAIDDVISYLRIFR